jgi:hypothetical protein
MRSVGIGALLVLGIAQTSCAELLSLIARDGKWLDSSRTSYQFTIGLDYPVTSQDLAMWTLVCKIIPIDGGPANALIFGEFTAPGDYIFSDGSFGISRSDNSPLGTTFSDIALNTRTLQTNENPNLIQLTVTASAAIGRYDIVVVPFDPAVSDGSNWASSDFQQYAFDVIPPPGRPSGDGIIESVVFSSVPEPCGLIVLLSAGTAFLVPGLGKKI